MYEAVRLPWLSGQIRLRRQLQKAECLNLLSPRQKDKSDCFQKSYRRLSALQSGFLTAGVILGNLFPPGFVLKFNIAEIENLSVHCIATKRGPATVKKRSEPNDRKVAHCVSSVSL
jgi:hypothetical protein